MIRQLCIMCLTLSLTTFSMSAITTTTPAPVTTLLPVTLPPVTIPPLATLNTTCTLTITALVAVPVAQAQGICHSDDILDRVCCQNLVVVGTSGVGLVAITQTCAPNYYCCFLKADIEKITGMVTILCWPDLFVEKWDESSYRNHQNFLSFATKRN